MFTLTWGIMIIENGSRKVVLQWNNTFATLDKTEAEAADLIKKGAFKDRFGCLIFNDKGQVVTSGKVS